ncbi:MAG: Lrp/AsnC family transcriptional regulator, partial [Pseudonocardia sp.]|nr:Lrp/AsnC family transcriptional regulator [Pseudonocardia sp.]
MITAIVLVHVAADRIPEAAQSIADLDGVDEVYSCAG